MLFQLIVAGLAIGAIYSLIALGFVMLLRVMNLLNIAQGEMVMAGAFLGLLFYVALKLPFPVAFILALGLVFLLGFLVERLGIRPLKNPTLINMITATVAISIILVNAGMLLGGVRPLPFPSPIREAPVALLGVRVAPLSLAIIGISLILMGALQVFFYLTRAGIAMRAVMDDKEAASLMGVKVVTVVALAFAISAALGASAGLLVAPLIFVSFDMGLIAIKAFAGAVLGGLYSFPGAVLGGFLLGIIETLTAAYVSSGYKDVVPMALLIIVLLIRPQGIFSRG